MRVIEGETLTLTQSFTDASGEPLLPLDFSNGPLITALDSNGDILIESNAIPDGVPGTWSTTVSVPVLELRDEITVSVIWFFEHESGNDRVVQSLIIEPQREHRITDVVVLLDGDGTTFDVVVPWAVRDTDSVTFSLSLNNEVVARYSTTDKDVELLNAFSSRTEYRLPIAGTPARIAPYALIAMYKASDKSVANSNKTTTYKVWPVTPQILVAASMVQDFCDRARLDNVIPELEYTQADLIQYLYRGLSTFNSLPPRATDFTGTNMQGQFLDAWITCACSHALSAQFLAEGSLAFDFSGQTVSLNMDRSPAIESTLGRLESQLNTVVMPFKKLIGRAGVISGDGSQGGRLIDGSQKFGVLGVTNSPTTRMGSASITNQRRVWMQAHYGIRRG